MRKALLVVKIHGGLGNQMFQYAFAKALQLRHGAPVKIDVQYCRWHRRRPLLLDRFDISLPIADLEDLQIFRSKKTSAWKLGLLNRMAGASLRHRSARLVLRKLLKQNLVEPDRFEYVEGDGDVSTRLAERSHPIYLTGYWQDPGHFGEFAAQVQADFRLRDSLSAPALEISRWIAEQACPVSVHVRRGDYVASEKVKKMFAALPLDYYRRSMSFIAQRQPPARFLVFSDDTDWVRANLDDGGGSINVAEGARSPHEDMLLMSECSHHIIANSTFSWWGAWLGRRPGKLVIAPQQWGLGERTRRITRHIVPDDWTRL